MWQSYKRAWEWSFEWQQNGIKKLSSTHSHIKKGSQSSSCTRHSLAYKIYVRRQAKNGLPRSQTHTHNICQCLLLSADAVLSKYKKRGDDDDDDDFFRIAHISHSGRETTQSASERTWGKAVKIFDVRLESERAAAAKSEMEGKGRWENKLSLSLSLHRYVMMILDRWND